MFKVTPNILETTDNIWGTDWFYESVESNLVYSMIFENFGTYYYP